VLKYIAAIGKDTKAAAERDSDGEGEALTLVAEKRACPKANLTETQGNRG